MSEIKSVALELIQKREHEEKSPTSGSGLEGGGVERWRTESPELGDRPNDRGQTNQDHQVARAGATRGVVYCLLVEPGHARAAIIHELKFDSKSLFLI